MITGGGPAQTFPWSITMRGAGRLRLINVNACAGRIDLWEPRIVIVGGQLSGASRALQESRSRWQRELIPVKPLQTNLTGDGIR